MKHAMITIQINTHTSDSTGKIIGTQTTEHTKSFPENATIADVYAVARKFKANRVAITFENVDTPPTKEPK